MRQKCILTLNKADHRTRFDLGRYLISMFTSFLVDVVTGESTRNPENSAPTENYGQLRLSSQNTESIIRTLPREAVFETTFLYLGHRRSGFNEFKRPSSQCASIHGWMNWCFMSCINHEHCRQLV